MDTAPKTLRSFLIIWFGELISMVGSGLTTFALGVYIYEKTGQATPFAMTMLISRLPVTLLLPVTGLLADRWNRRWLMVLADTGSALTTLAVALLSLFGMLDVWHIYVVSFFYAVFSAFQEPAYRASIAMLVPKKDLARANGLMSAGDAVQMLASPLLAGLLLGLIGLSGIILIDFITFFFAVGALLIVSIPQPALKAEEARRKASLRADTAFAWGWLRERPGLFWLIWYFALVNFLANFVWVLVTPMVLGHSSVEVLGVIRMVIGGAMLAGGTLMGAWGGPKRRLLGVMGAIVGLGVGMMVAGAQPSPYFNAAGLWIMFMSLPVAQGCNSAISQSKIEPSIQGRVFAVRSLIGQSLTPLAFLCAGPLADYVFNPLMQKGWLLGDSFPGQLLGAGNGIGLMYVLSGMALITATAVAWSYRPIRQVEFDLPDVVAVAGEQPEVDEKQSDRPAESQPVSDDTQPVRRAKPAGT